jgi:multiple sugar transport system substrate-binding protein
MSQHFRFNCSVVFPARPEATEVAKATQLSRGIDVSGFTLLATPATTFPFPITDHGSEISSVLKTAVNKVLLNQGDPAKILKTANDEVNAMF